MKPPSSWEKRRNAWLQAVINSKAKWKLRYEAKQAAAFNREFNSVWYRYWNQKPLKYIKPKYVIIRHPAAWHNPQLSYPPLVVIYPLCSLTPRVTYG